MDKEFDFLLSGLSLTFTKYDEYNGTWYYIYKDHFDLFMLEEPYHSFTMLVNFSSSEYIFRVLGTTKERGFYSNIDDLREIVENKFANTVACVGNPRLRAGTGAIQVEAPFSMTLSPRCSGYYTQLQGEEVAQGRGRCGECREEVPAAKHLQDNNNTWLEDSGRTSGSQTDEDMKIIGSDFENEDIPVKRKRGRPKKIIPLESLKNKRKLSDCTKKKIAENNKKFSICKLCQKQCRGFRGLVDHMHKDHSDYKPWKCNFCDTSTAFVKTLYRHLKQVHQVNECPCPKCGKTYSRAQSMLFHMTKHEEEDKVEMLSCGECGVKFKKKSKLEQHVEKHHNTSFHCDTCSKQFSDPASLEEHVRTHTGERPYQCTECGLTFSFQSSFVAHRKVHLREQNVSEEEAKLKLYFFCETCGKSFTNKSSLKTHKLHVHEKYSEEVPCDVCGISFRTRELLKHHQERQHNEWPRFACETCGQRFGSNYHLKRHQIIHTNEEIPCPLCSRRFKRKDGLDTHMSHIHGVTSQELSSFNKTPVQDAQEVVEEEEEEGGEEKSFTELISYDSLYTQKDLLAVEDPFLTTPSLTLDQLEENTDYNDQVELNHKDDNIMTQLESLSQYKPISTLARPSSGVFQIENLAAGETYETLAPCVPVLEPYMSTPIIRAESLDNIEHLEDHEILSSDTADLQQVRQSVIRLKKKIIIK